jgi:hypothetical protein
MARSCSTLTHCRPSSLRALVMVNPVRLDSLQVRSYVTLLLTSVSLGLIIAADGLRTGALVLAACAAIAFTRVRFSGQLAAALLALVALIAVTGHPITDIDRSNRNANSDRASR